MHAGQRVGSTWEQGKGPGWFQEEKPRARHSFPAGLCMLVQSSQP